MRKIETIKKDIERAHAAIEKAEASIPGLQTRMDNAIARAKKAGWDYKGDGNDSHDAPWGAAYQACSTADQAREGIANRKATIAGRKMDLECLERELAEAEAKVNAIPQTLKDYQVELTASLIRDRKFRRDFAKNDIAERKLNGEWVTREDLSNKWNELDLSNKSSLHDPAWKAYHELKARKEEQEKIERAAAVTDEMIEKTAAEDAADLIQDLAQRVARYVGTATDCSGLKIKAGTHGYAVLNGIVVGDQGRCEVVSKGVAGYNIVCWHIRVNVFPVKGEA